LPFQLHSCKLSNSPSSPSSLHHKSTRALNQFCNQTIITLSPKTSPNHPHRAAHINHLHHFINSSSHCFCFKITKPVLQSPTKSPCNSNHHGHQFKHSSLHSSQFITDCPSRPPFNQITTKSSAITVLHHQYGLKARDSTTTFNSKSPSSSLCTHHGAPICKFTPYHHHCNLASHTTSPLVLPRARARARAPLHRRSPSLLQSPRSIVLLCRHRSLMLQSSPPITTAAEP
jgi:hypothetical protein